MTTVLLMRHGDALSPGRDGERALSERGRADAVRVTESLAAAGISVDLVFHSGLKRAAETAGILGRGIGRDITIRRRAGLSPSDDVEEIAAELETTEVDTAVVGHLPHLEILLDRLAGEREGEEYIGTACVVHLDRDRSGWRIMKRYRPGR